jgi:hypothetical protein
MSQTPFFGYIFDVSLRLIDNFSFLHHYSDYTMSMRQDLKSNVITQLLGEEIELLPNINELFEIELAFLEYKNLSNAQLLELTAYIKSINKNNSRHYMICSNIPDSIQEKSSTAVKAYFSKTYTRHEKYNEG